MLRRAVRTCNTCVNPVVASPIKIDCGWTHTYHILKQGAFFSLCYLGYNIHKGENYSESARERARERVKKKKKKKKKGEKKEKERRRKALVLSKWFLHVKSKFSSSGRRYWNGCYWKGCYWNGCCILLCLFGFRVLVHSTFGDPLLALRDIGSKAAHRVANALR